jgi:hypothetical protein
MFGMAIGELLMVGAACVIVRDVVDRRTIGDVLRTLIAGFATILLLRLLPDLTPFLAIPLCILAFAGLSLLVGAVQRTDLEPLLASFRKKSLNPKVESSSDPER